MIQVLETGLRRLRLLVSRSEWSLRFLKLDPSELPESQKGLLIIQIDGLARSQLEKAIKAGRMPFLRRLLKREGYSLHTVYSGMPSSTPAAQAELFYGVKGAVPSFSFRDNDTGRFSAMLHPEAARKVENHMEKEGESPLLRDGCSYMNIFTGGAKESHFCASSLGAADIWKQTRFWRFFPVLLWNLRSVVRLVTLLFVEIFIALYDSVRGAIKLGEYRREFIFVFTRVIVAVGLRELVAIFGSMDVTRGMPIVHANFCGYDEQSHRRGPSSRFAQFTLRGIDGAIKRLWHAAHRSPRRDYDIWILSDHGQETVTSYYREKGKSLHEAISELLGLEEIIPTKTGRNQGGEMMTLGGNFESYLLKGFRWMNKELVAAFPILQKEVLVTSMGPVGQLYPPGPLSAEQREAMAEKLVAELGIPIVLTAVPTENNDLSGEGTTPGRKALAYTASGRYLLPEEAAPVLGEKHPFLEECARDFVDICHHPNAGVFVLSGWRPRGRSLTFGFENGSHGGPGYEETRAFALLPGNAPLPAYKGYLRHSDLREAAFHVRGRRSTLLDYRRKVRLAEKTLRVMTYNIHGCVGMDGRVSAERIAEVIDHYEPDVIALQESKSYPTGHRYQNQAEEIAHILIQRFHFHLTPQVEQDDYGNAILSTLPMRLRKRGHLPTLQNRNLEERGALWAEVTLHGQKLQFINTHLGLFSQERMLQAQHLLGKEWLSSDDFEEPVILCGDFNAFPWSAAYKKLAQRLYEAQENMAWHKPLGTLWGRYPVSRIDHVFCSVGIETLKIEVPRTQLTRLASDHLPIIAELTIP